MRADKGIGPPQSVQHSPRQERCRHEYYSEKHHDHSTVPASRDGATSSTRRQPIDLTWEAYHTTMTLLLSSNGLTEAWPVEGGIRKNAGAVYRSLSNLKTRQTRRTGNGGKFYRATNFVSTKGRTRTARAETHEAAAFPLSHGCCVTVAA